LRKILFPVVLAAALLCLPAVARAACYGDTDPLTPTIPGNVCGSVSYQRYNGPRPAAGKMYVKICRAGTTYCTTTTTYAATDGSGQSVQAYKFGGYAKNLTDYVTYDLYTWSYTSNGFWGSSTKPSRQIRFDRYGVEGASIVALPRPLQPNPVYPSGNDVPDHYLVRWLSGIDIDRAAYPITYEIWFKYWPVDGVEPAEWTLSRAGMPCQDNGGGPDANNECSTYVTGPQPAGNWMWHVVASFNADYKTTSNWIYFYQPY
jgi:hypothetical protein